MLLARKLRLLGVMPKVSNPVRGAGNEVQKVKSTLREFSGSRSFAKVVKKIPRSLGNVV